MENFDEITWGMKKLGDTLHEVLGLESGRCGIGLPELMILKKLQSRILKTVLYAY